MNQFNFMTIDVEVPFTGTAILLIRNSDNKIVQLGGWGVVAGNNIASVADVKNGEHYCVEVLKREGEELVCIYKNKYCGIV